MIDRPARVLVVDDSALIRQVLTQALSAAPGIEVIGTAQDPYVARDKIKALAPDVLTLDIEMPRMDGLAFLEKLMRARPMPVVMVSTLTAAGAEATLRALELGAVDFVTKPRVGVLDALPTFTAEVVEKVRAAARARVRVAAPRLAAPATPATPVAARQSLSTLRATDTVIAMGASTGGTEALREVLETLPPDAPGIVVVQHMPEHFTRAFAQRLDQLCTVRVSEASDGDRVLVGHVLIAPGNHHMRVVRDGAAVRVRISQDPPVNRHRPSVDVLFHSVAERMGPNALGVIMTGMGADGAQGLLAMRRAGARTVAQDEATCVVFGMPREAIAAGAAEKVVALGKIAPTVLDLLAERPLPTRAGS
jgi:two-component system, chemotaxis family, protein-glutamate methylesterase/glutaminase